MITTKLDPILLTTPFRVQTNWHVLTGAACTGKTTLIDALARKGFQVVPEIARQHFERELAKGRTIEEIRKDDVTLQRDIAAEQLRFEHEYEATRLTFLDRAFPDSLTFYRIFGMDPNEILPDCFQHRYSTVFILDRLPLQRNKPWDRKMTLLQIFSMVGSNVITVPWDTTW